jgi:hypothetical protein
MVIPFSRAGIKRVLFDLFIDSPHLINSNRNINAVLKAIRCYPSAGIVIFASNNKRIMSPSNIKKMLLILITCGILTLTYVKDIDDVVVGMARVSNHDDDVLAIDDDALWGMIETI